MMYKSPTQQEVDAFFADLKEQENKYGVKIDFDPSCIRDRHHLDCLWYGGRVGTIEYRGYKIVIGAYGDIRISGYINGEPFNFKDKNNWGDAFIEFGDEIDDERLYTLYESEDEQNQLIFDNNNWFEVDLISPSGDYIDLCDWDNVIDNNIIDNFRDVSAYFGYVDEIIKEEEKQMSDKPLMQMLIEAGYPEADFDHHASDLYCYKTPLTDKVLAEWLKANNFRNDGWLCKTFRDQITGRTMYDCAFQYIPWWEEHCGGTSND